MSRSKKILFLPLFFYLVFAIGQDYTPANISILFSPKNGIAENLCKILNKEQNEVLILASKFSGDILENCLINIQKHGRRVRLVLDSKFITSDSGKLKRLLKSGVCVYSDSMHNTSHNKVVVAGNDFVFTGSYNFTDDSEYNNAENGIFIRSNEINKIYKTEFLNHLNHSSLVKSKFMTSDQCSK